MKEDIHQLLDELPALEAELLRLRYGIAAGEPLSLSAPARQMGITRGTAHGLEWGCECLDPASVDTLHGPSRSLTSLRHHSRDQLR
jgi:hypothetical protein